MSQKPDPNTDDPNTDDPKPKQQHETSKPNHPPKSNYQPEPSKSNPQQGSSKPNHHPKLNPQQGSSKLNHQSKYNQMNNKNHNGPRHLQNNKPTIQHLNMPTYHYNPQNYDSGRSIGKIPDLMSIHPSMNGMMPSMPPGMSRPPGMFGPPGMLAKPFMADMFERPDRMNLGPGFNVMLEYQHLFRESRPGNNNEVVKKKRTHKVYKPETDSYVYETDSAEDDEHRDSKYAYVGNRHIRRESVQKPLVFPKRKKVGENQASKDVTEASNSQRKVINKSEKMLKDVIGNLKCAACSGFLQSPIYICSTGHNICSSCRDNLCVLICKVCNESITDQRNFTLENICEKMCEACPNAQNGCDFPLSSENLKSHLEECGFRQYYCPFYGKSNNKCSWIGNYNQLTAHFSDSHKSNCTLRLGSPIVFPNFDVNKPDSDLQLLTHSQKLFVYHVRIDIQKNVALWAVQFVGSEQEAEKWQYNLIFYNPKKAKKMIEVTEECVTHETDIDEIFESGRCVAIPLFVLKNFVLDNKNLKFKIFIKMPRPHLAITDDPIKDMELLDLCDDGSLI